MTAAYLTSTFHGWAKLHNSMNKSALGSVILEEINKPEWAYQAVTHLGTRALLRWIEPPPGALSCGLPLQRWCVLLFVSGALRSRWNGWQSPHGPVSYCPGTLSQGLHLQHCTAGVCFHLWAERSGPGVTADYPFSIPFTVWTYLAGISIRIFVCGLPTYHLLLHLWNVCTSRIMK